MQVTAVREGAPYNALLAGQQVSFALAAANLYGAALAAAAPGGAMPTDLAFTIGRTLGIRGWSTGLVQIDADGEPFILPADLWVHAGTWTGATRPLDGEIGRSVVAPDAAVVSVRLPDGVAPLSRLNPAADIGARLDGSMVAEAETPVARLIGLGALAMNMPASARTEISTSLEDAVVEGKRQMVTPSDVEQSRIGKLQPDPSTAALSLREQVRTDVEAAYGLTGLLSNSAGAEFSELWRVATVRTFEPLARLVEVEAARKLGSPIRFNRDAWIPASQLELARATALRAQAFNRLVGAGVEVDRAITLAGLEA